ncbi:MAG: DUF4382 domain-containing protein [Chitinophagaceae bacterium]|nr:MAG: DUF4382 domain-containing protein [Chitinophagaceae bacterium]
MSFLKNRKLPVTSLAIAAGMLLYFTSCQTNGINGSSGPSHFQVYLTDSPGDYQAVNIDIQKVMVNVSSDTSDNSSGWKEVTMLRPGVYNLLNFRNGADTILAGVDLPAGSISQIRLVLGDSNSVVLNDGTVIPLKTPSAQESGLKLNIHTTLTAGIPYALELDFDAARSIVKAGNSGKYLLKPVIRTFAKAAGGAIEGVVLPDSAQAHVLAITPGDTMGAIPDNSGYYKFWGVPTGAYQLIFDADTTTGYKNDSLKNINVQTGQVTTVDTVWLHQ